MKKVLVPTDFSENSKGGVRFAVQWSTIESIELVFVHALHISRQVQWSKSYFLKYSQVQRKKHRAILEEFAAEIYKSMSIKPRKYSCKIIEGFSPDLAILEYCRGHDNIAFVCISTRGAGRFKRLLGTITGNLITHSEIPVIAVPKNYRVKPFKQLMFATDFHSYRKELKQVLNFARPLKMPVDVLHFAWPDEAIPDATLIESGTRDKFRYPVKLYVKKSDATHTLIQRMQKEIDIRKPSLAVMFTDQKRTLFQKIFLSSKAEQLSFDLKVPLLVFHKN